MMIKYDIALAVILVLLAALTLVFVIKHESSVGDGMDVMMNIECNERFPRAVIS